MIDPQRPHLEPAEGDFDPNSRQIRLNLEFARNLVENGDPGFSSFRQRHFPDATITPLQFALAHEAMEAMDLYDLEEIDAHGIDKDKAVPGWRSYQGRAGGFSAFAHPTPIDSVTEPPLTSRAVVDGGEDFAESAAIAALGGDVSRIPQRMRRIQQTIALAKGNELNNPADINLARAA